MNGLQLGILNWTFGSSKGLQFGLFNWNTRGHDGLQIGVINSEPPYLILGVGPTFFKPIGDVIKEERGSLL